MAPPVYSTRLVAAYKTAVVNATLFTCPAGKRAVIKNVNIVPDVAMTATIYTVSAAGTIVFYSIGAAPALSNVEWSGMQVLYAGDTFDVFLSVGSGHFNANGYLFDDP